MLCQLQLIVYNALSTTFRWPPVVKLIGYAAREQVAASRIWGVIIIVSDIHRLHKEAATSSLLWKVVRLGKLGILWIAWMLPSLWVLLMWGTGLWARLDLACWSCFGSRDQPVAMPVAYRDYALASSGLAACLSIVAIAGLVWEQRQGQPSMDWIDPDKPALLYAGASTDVEAPLLSGGVSPSSDPTLPIWPSVRLRTVGLCNLLGLLLQIAVGIGALFPTMEGIILEIIALNHFALFAQGIATGLLLGGLSEAPAVRLVTRGAKTCGHLWTRCMDWYVDPRSKVS